MLAEEEGLVELFGPLPAVNDSAASRLRNWGRLDAALKCLTFEVPRYRPSSLIFALDRRRRDDIDDDGRDRVFGNGVELVVEWASDDAERPGCGNLNDPDDFFSSELS